MDTAARRGQRIGFMEDCFQNLVQDALKLGLGLMLDADAEG